MATTSKPKPPTTPNRTGNPVKRSSGSSNVGLWLIVSSVALVAVVVGLIVWNDIRSKSTPVAQPDLPAEWIGRTSMGNPDAKVTIEAFEDYLCPACQTFTARVKPQLFEEYIKTGLVRFEFHHFPLTMHAPGAGMTALATECAADQGMFWPYHDRVFAVAASDGQGGVQFEDLVGYAAGMGLNEQDFSQCLASQAHQDTINQSLADATTRQLSFTPSIIVNGQLVQNGTDFNSVKLAVDTALAAAQ